jgi:hypothetical protein
VIFDGTNYLDFAAFMRVHMRGLRLWGVLSGEVSCPPCPTAPLAPIPSTPPVLGDDATQEAKDAAENADRSVVAAYELKFQLYSSALETYRLDLTAYTQWMDEDARATAVLTSSVLPQFASEFMGLPTIADMWAHLRQCYQPSGDALYLSVVRQEHALQQGDSTIDEFYTQSAAIWRQLDSLRTAVYGTCPCCRMVRSDMEFQHVYEFLSRLCKEFEPRCAQLLARGRVPISEVLSELRAEETRLCGAGLLEVPSVLAARGPPLSPAPTQLRSPASSILPTSQGQGQSQHQGQHQQHRGQGRRPLRHCTYCNRDGHTPSNYYTRDPSLRPQHQARVPSGSSGSSVVALTDQDIISRLHGLLAATGSPLMGTASSVTDSSGTTRPPPSTQSGTSPWYLDSGASFHMTSDSSILSAFRSLISLVRVLTADGTSLTVSSRGTLSTSSFSVPDISHVPHLKMNLFSAGQLTNSGCRVILDADSCAVQDHHTQALVGAGPRRRDSSGLWELDWLRVPSAATSPASSPAVVASVTGSFQQWHHCLGHLCGSRLSSLVHCGLLGSVLGDVSLNCQGYRLGKQIQLPYPTSMSVSQCPFDLVHSDVWGPAPFALKGGHRYYILFIDDFSRYT